MIKRILLISILFIASVQGKAQTGLAFGPENPKSSLTVKGKYLQRLTRQDYEIAFKLSIDNAFGYIVRLIDDNGSCISILHATNAAGRGNVFSVSLEGKQNLLCIPVEQTGIEYGKWFDVVIRCTHADHGLTLTVNGVPFPVSANPAFNAKNIDIVFGSYPTNPEVLSMYIKDLGIRNTGDKNLFFPLDESSGKFAKDISGKIKAAVVDPQWLILQHSSWKKLGVIPASGLARIIYNQSTGNILILSQDSITNFNPQNSVARTSAYKNRLPFPLMHGGAAFFPEDNKIMLYNIGDIYDFPLNIAWLDLHDMTWGQCAHNNLSNRLHHHNMYLDDASGDCFLFGGFGVQTYSNALYRFNRDSQNFQETFYSGDNILPRMFPAVGKGRSENEILVFGGFGNETGHQELGGRNLYDLYSIDIRNKTAKKLWSAPYDGEPFVPCRNLFVDDSLKSFYVLCYPHQIQNSSCTLYRISIDTPALNPVSDPFPLVSDKIESETFLFSNSQRNRFYAVSKRFFENARSEVSVYKLLYPPVSPSEIFAENKHLKQKVILCAVITVGAFALGCIIIIIILRKHKMRRLSNASNTSMPAAQTNETEPDTRSKKNRIFLLGDFRVYDKSGFDATHRFSPTVKELFLLLLLYSEKHGEGISTPYMSSIIWPDRTLRESKNIRGVRINNLRSILCDLENVSLKYDNGRWELSLPPETGCDYLEILNVPAENWRQETAVKELLNNLERGQFLISVNYDWLDEYRDRFEDRIGTLLFDSLQFFYSNHNYDLSIRICKKLMIIDPLNEDVLRYHINALIKKGKTAQAQLAYNIFVENYLQTYEEPYITSFEKMTSWNL